MAINNISTNYVATEVNKVVSSINTERTRRNNIGSAAPTVTAGQVISQSVLDSIKNPLAVVNASATSTLATGEYLIDTQNTERKWKLSSATMTAYANSGYDISNAYTFTQPYSDCMYFVASYNSTAYFFYPYINFKINLQGINGAGTNTWGNIWAEVLLTSKNTAIPQITYKANSTDSSYTTASLSAPSSSVKNGYILRFKIGQSDGTIEINVGGNFYGIVECTLRLYEADYDRVSQGNIFRDLDTHQALLSGVTQNVFQGYSNPSYDYSNVTGCNESCSGLCFAACGGSCSGSCTGTCTSTCANSCTLTCATNCTGSCSGGCSGGCQGGCGSGCSSGCTGSCSGDCSGSCDDGCTDGFMSVCPDYSG